MSELYDGKTPFQILKERGLLDGLTDVALANAYHKHVEHEKRQATVYNVAEAEAFNWMQKNDVNALIELRRKEPAKFERWQEAYLKHAEYLEATKIKDSKCKQPI